MNNKNTIGLLGTSILNTILYMFLNTFMVAYFITLTNYDYKLISIYYILSFISIIITFMLFGNFVKTKNKLLIYRLGIILHCIYVLTIALLKENIIDYYIYLGLFYGIVQGTFWVSGHSLINEYIGTNPENFVSLKSILSRFLKIIVPIIFGVSIELTSFSYIAKIVIIISIIQILFSFLIKKDIKQKNKKYDLNKFYSKYKNNKELQQYYKMSLCDGIVNYLLDTLITIVIVMTFKTTISLGFLTTIFSICSIVSVYIYQKKIQNKQLILKIGAIAMCVSVLLLIFYLNKTTVVIYNLCSGIFLILLRNNADSKRYTITSNIKEIKENYLTEHQVISEIHLNISRIIGYTILLIASLFKNMILFKILLGLVTIVIILYTKFMINIENKRS